MLGRPEEAAEDEGLRPEGIIPRHSQLRFLQGNIFSVINSGIKVDNTVCNISQITYDNDLFPLFMSSGIQFYYNISYVS